MVWPAVLQCKIQHIHLGFFFFFLKPPGLSNFLGLLFKSFLPFKIWARGNLRYRSKSIDLIFFRFLQNIIDSVLKILNLFFLLSRPLKRILIRFY